MTAMEKKKAEMEEQRLKFEKMQADLEQEKARYKEMMAGAGSGAQGSDL